MQIGVGIDVNPNVSLAACGEVSGGIGNRYIVEGRLGGMGEMYCNKLFGIGVGGGFSFFSKNEFDRATATENAFMRYALMLIRGNYKTSVFAQRYFIGDWGFGVQFGWQF
jgi:hypothetical protein